MTDPARSAPPAPHDPLAEPPPPDSSTEPRYEPAHRLAPSPRIDRSLRRTTTAVGTAAVLVVVLALALASTATWWVGRGFDPVPAISGLGRPAALTLEVGVGDVRVLPSADVDELTLALVEPGETTLPPSHEQVPARIAESERGGRASVRVDQPSLSVRPPWADDRRDVLLLVPTDLELALEVRADAGDVLADGEFTSLQAHSDAGDLLLGPLSAPDGVRASASAGDISLELSSPAPTAVDLSAEVGDIDLLLPTDAGGRVTVTADIGDIEVAAPGTGRWRVEAESELGEVRTDPGLDAGTGAGVGTLTATSELGTIRLSR